MDNKKLNATHAHEHQPVACIGTIFSAAEIVCSHLSRPVFFPEVIKYSAFTPLKERRKGATIPEDRKLGPSATSLESSPTPPALASPFPEHSSAPPFLCSPLASPPDIDSGHYVSKQPIYLHYCISISLSVKSLMCISVESFLPSPCGCAPAGSASTARLLSPTVSDADPHFAVSSHSTLPFHVSPFPPASPHPAVHCVPFCSPPCHRFLPRHTSPPAAILCQKRVLILPFYPFGRHFSCCASSLPLPFVPNDGGLSSNASFRARSQASIRSFRSFLSSPPARTPPHRGASLRESPLRLDRSRSAESRLIRRVSALKRPSAVLASLHPPRLSPSLISPDRRFHTRLYPRGRTQHCAVNL